MKKYFKISWMCLFLFFINKMLIAQELIYKETFGVPTRNVSLDSYGGYDNLTIDYYCIYNKSSVRPTRPSTIIEYELASGGGNVYLGDSTHTLFIEKIPIASYKNLILGLGIYKDRVGADAEDLRIKFVVDGDTTGAMGYQLDTGPGTTGYYWIETDWNYIPQGDSLSILIENLSVNPFRIDDIYLWGESEALPILLVNFELKFETNSWCFYWKTLKEENVENFIIEISHDGKFFSEFQRYPARNTINGSAYKYCYSKINIRNEKTYFRLKSQDWDGNRGYSKIIVAENVYLENNLPNILKKNTLFEDFHNKNLKVLRIWSLDGRELFNSKNNNTSFFRNRNLQTGLYVVEVRDIQDRDYVYKIQIVD